MSDRQDINAIFDRIANRNATDGDIQTLRQSVVIGGNAQGATIVTGDDNIIGDNNTVQVGKYNINIAEGSNIKVGDTIYQGADAETIRAMLLEILTDKIVIDSTFSRLFDKSASSDVDWDWGIKLLKQKQLPEIRKRLTDTLGHDRILMDVSIEEQQNWVNRSPLAADRTLQINGKDCGTLDANKMLIETFGRDDIEGKLLILGAPGAGKTTALLSLAEQLVYGAISQPKTVIPVIFELSTWQNDNQSIQDWLIEQLYDLHGGNRKSKLYEQWLERQVLLPLLDGLDELGLERQKKCTEKLNEFAEHYPQLVVCCRVKEFEAVDIKLRNLRGAVCLQSLSDSQIRHYFDSLQRPELWEAIQTTPSLQAMLEPNIDGDPGLLRVPLFVKLVADVYDPQQPISSKADLLDKYIDRQLSFDKREFDRRKELDNYKWAYKIVEKELNCEITHSHLNWLAQNLQIDNKVDFLIEYLQPSWINSLNPQKDHLEMYSFFELIFYLPILFSSLDNWFSDYFGNSFWFWFKIIIVVLGSILLSIFSHTSSSEDSYSINIDLTESFRVPIAQDFPLIKRIIIKNIICQAKFFAIVTSLIVIVIVIGRLAIDEHEHHFYDFISISSFFSFFSFFPSIILYNTILFSTSEIFPLLIKALKKELKIRSYPNQGIWKTFQNAIFVTIIALLILFILGFFNNSGGFVYILYLAILISLNIGGGRALLQHLSLRIVLWQSGLPWNFARFLNYCVERRLLLRVGGSYRFLHRELLDHFAQSSR
jgi:Effector-associated domain 10/NACHT domain